MTLALAMPDVAGVPAPVVLAAIGVVSAALALVAKLVRLALVVAGLAVGAYGLHAAGVIGEPADAAADGARVVRAVRAVDGDTLLVRLAGKQERVRVLGINTPETVKPGAPVECYGPQASKNAKTWVASHRRVRLRPDRAAPDRDRYGRLLRYVEPRDGGRDLSTVQVAGGYARVAAYGQNITRLRALQRAQRTAKNNHRGLWSACR